MQCFESRRFYFRIELLAAFEKREDLMILTSICMGHSWAGAERQLLLWTRDTVPTMPYCLALFLCHLPTPPAWSPYTFSQVSPVSDCFHCRVFSKGTRRVCVVSQNFCLPVFSLSFKPCFLVWFGYSSPESPWSCYVKSGALLQTH